MGKILVLSVCYNNEDEIIQFASSLKKQTVNENIYFSVVCNKCLDPQKLEREIRATGLKNIRLCVPTKNLGYLNGCIYEVENLFSKEKFEWVQITNTDMLFCDNDFYEKLLNKEVDVDVWGIAPYITSVRTQKALNPFKESRPSKKSMFFRKAIYSSYVLLKVYFKLVKLKNKIFSKKTVAEEKNIYSAHGCSFFLRPGCVIKIKETDNNIFLYGEEIFVSEIIKNNNKKLLYYPEIKLLHNENQVTGKIDYRSKQKWHKQSLEYLYKKFFS